MKSNPEWSVSISIWSVLPTHNANIFLLTKKKKRRHNRFHLPCFRRMRTEFDCTVDTYMQINSRIEIAT